jgi:hypothetical protein
MKVNCADAMTMITGNLCVPVDRVYALYNEFLDDNLYTHQLPRAGRFAEPIVREQLPELAAYLAGRKITPENWQQEIAAAREEFGDEFTIQTAAQAWQHMHPLDEPILKGKEVVVVDAPEAQS